MSKVIFLLAVKSGMRVVRKSAPGILILALAVYFSGCTAVGFTVGYVIDESTEEYSTVKPGGLDRVKEGQEIKAKLTDGLTPSGKFQGLVEADSSEYRKRYDREIEKLGFSKFLHLGDSVSFQYAVAGELKAQTAKSQSNVHIAGSRYEKGAEVKGKFLGFDQRLGEEPCAARFFLREEGTEAVFSEKLKYLSYFNLPAGDSLKGDTICRLIGEHKIPMRSELLMKVDLLDDRYPMERVVEVKVKNKRNAAMKGAFVGALIDLAIVIAMATYDWGEMSLGGGGSW